MKTKLYPLLGLALGTALVTPVVMLFSAYFWLLVPAWLLWYLLFYRALEGDTGRWIALGFVLVLDPFSGLPWGSLVVGALIWLASIELGRRVIRLNSASPLLGWLAVIFYLGEAWLVAIGLLWLSPWQTNWLISLECTIIAIWVFKRVVPAAKFGTGLNQSDIF